MRKAFFFLLLLSLGLLLGCTPNVVGPPTGDVPNNFYSGWIEYSDNVYNSTNRLTIGSTKVNFSMLDYTTREQELPVGITNTTWFNGTHILTDRAGNSFLIRWRYYAEPQFGNTFCQFWYDIGHPVPDLTLRIITFPKGQNVEQIGTFSNVEYTLDTWYANGAAIEAECSNDVEFWNIELTIGRIHIGRGEY